MRPLRGLFIFDDDGFFQDFPGAVYRNVVCYSKHETIAGAGVDFYDMCDVAIKFLFEKQARKVCCTFKVIDDNLFDGDVEAIKYQVY